MRWNRRFLMIAIAGVLLLPALTPMARAGGDASRQRAAVAPKSSAFQPNQLEAYLSDVGISYIRPGVKLNLLSVTNVAPNKKPVVEFTLTDQFDQPLDLARQADTRPHRPRLRSRTVESRHALLPLADHAHAQRRHHSVGRYRRHLDRPRDRSLQVHLRHRHAGEPRHIEDADPRRVCEADADRHHRQGLLRRQRLQGFPSRWQYSRAGMGRDGPRQQLQPLPRSARAARR